MMLAFWTILWCTIKLISGRISSLISVGVPRDNRFPLYTDANCYKNKTFYESDAFLIVLSYNDFLFL